MPLAVFSCGTDSKAHSHRVLRIGLADTDPGRFLADPLYGIFTSRKQTGA